MGKILIDHIGVNTIIGTLPGERIHKQRLWIDLELELDLSKAAASDDLRDSVNYAEVERCTVELAEKSSFFLLEALAGAIGRKLLEFDITKARVTVTKPAGSAAGRGVSVVMEFAR